MIAKFNNAEVRSSAIIYQSGLEQIKKLYSQDPQLAGELAICMCEIALTGQHSSDNLMIDIMLENLKAVSKKDKQKYDDRQEAQRQKKIKDQQLDQIAELLNGGYNQSQIARKLGTTKQTVSNRVKKIKELCPELLLDTSIGQASQENDNESSFDNLTSIDCQEEMFDGQENLIDCQENELDKSLTFCQEVNQVKYNDNDNENDNDNQSLSSNEERLLSVSLSELNSMGVDFVWLDGSTIRVKDTGKVFEVDFEV